MRAGAARLPSCSLSFPRCPGDLMLINRESYSTDDWNFQKTAHSRFPSASILPPTPDDPMASKLKRKKRTRSLTYTCQGQRLAERMRKVKKPPQGSGLSLGEPRASADGQSDDEAEPGRLRPAHLRGFSGAVSEVGLSYRLSDAVWPWTLVSNSRAAWRPACCRI